MGDVEALPGVGKRKKLSAEERAKKREQAKCCQEVLRKAQAEQDWKAYAVLFSVAIGGLVSGQLCYVFLLKDFWQETEARTEGATVDVVSDQGQNGSTADDG